MKKQKLFTILCAAALTVSASITSFAGSWAFDGPEVWQWKYVNDDGTLAAPGWNMIDGKWYHMDSNSYLDIGLRVFDEKVYYLSKSPETLGQMYQNVSYLNGYYGDDGVWTDNEHPMSIWARWSLGQNWTEADTLSWTAQFAAYHISPALFVPFNEATMNTPYQMRYLIPKDQLDAYYDIAHTLTVQLLMLNDYNECFSRVFYSWNGEWDAEGNIIIVFDYIYY